MLQETFIWVYFMSFYFMLDARMTQALVHTQTHTSDRLLYLDQKVVGTYMYLRADVFSTGNTCI